MTQVKCALQAKPFEQRSSVLVSQQNIQVRIGYFARIAPAPVNVEVGVADGSFSAVGECPARAIDLGPGESGHAMNSHRLFALRYRVGHEPGFRVGGHRAEYPGQIERVPKVWAPLEMLRSGYRLTHLGWSILRQLDN